MAKSTSHYLVVGADSMVGAALITRLRQSGASVTGTTRRRDKVGSDCFFLDLSREPHLWQPPRHVDAAFLCAGITGIQTCKQKPVESRRINVEGISQIANNLHNAGAFVIYLSTNQVFDGSKPFRSPQDSRNPVTEYGRQKAEAERRLLADGTAGAIVRLTKVLGPANSLFSAWAHSLQGGQSIQPYSDMTFAPVPLSCVVSVLKLIGARRLNGIFHISGEKDITYEMAARIGAQAMGVEMSLVKPVKYPRDDAQLEPVPAHTTLNVDALKSAIGIVPPNVQWAVETAFLRPHLLDP